MSLFLSLVLTATPASCAEVFPNLWNAWLERERLAEEPPRFAKVPDARERVEKAWLAECAALDTEAIDCARGLVLQQRIASIQAAARQRGGEEAAADAEREIARVKQYETVLYCARVDPAMTKAVDSVVPNPHVREPRHKEAPRPPKPPKTRNGDVID